MTHPLLGKWIQIGDLTLKIGFLRRECDAGVSDPWLDRKDGSKDSNRKALLIRLSDQTIIRELEKGEDYNAAVLSAAPAALSDSSTVEAGSANE